MVLKVVFLADKFKKPFSPKEFRVNNKNMSYSYDTCFWDPNDNGVNVLLEHVGNGIKSMDGLTTFFKLRAELEKDYARRLGAAIDLYDKSYCEEYGALFKTIQSFFPLERSRALAHSKLSELVYRQVYSELKSLQSELSARLTTLSGRIEKLRFDKYDKKKGCESLSVKLRDAEVRLSELNLNKNNIIGNRRKIESLEKEQKKWESNVHEFQIQLNVLKQEYKASQKFWINEWHSLSHDLQHLEIKRISTIQVLLQSFAQTAIDTSIIEQTKMETLINELATFTPMDDISKFSSEFGTGRLKEKRQRSSRLVNGNTSTASKPSMENLSSSHMSRGPDPYVENIRKLSSQLQKTTVTPRVLKVSRTEGTDNGKSYRAESNDYQMLNSSASIEHRPSSFIPSSSEPYSNSNGRNTNETLRRRVHEDKEDRRVSDHLRVGCQPKSIEREPSFVKNIEKSASESGSYSSGRHSFSPSSSSGTSSNPTDFSHKIKSHRSMDSLATSVSSMASSIDDSQRFAKSWNSANRKRKSMSHLQSPEINISTIDDQLDNSKNTTAQRTTHPSQSTNTFNRDVSSNTILVDPRYQSSKNSMDMSRVRSSRSIDSSRRKSMVLDSSVNPISDALNEMERIKSGGSSTAYSDEARRKDLPSGYGRVDDNGMPVTLPTITKEGEEVIKFAKALYPLINSEAQELANFEKGDYLLLTEVVNEDWYRGEVYGNSNTTTTHGNGLIPSNFIQILHNQL